MNSILIDNFNKSVSQAQNCIYLATTICFTLNVLAKLNKFDQVTIPIINMSVDGTTGVGAFSIIYIFIGVVLTISTLNASKNFKAIKDLSTRRALMLNPSIVCGNRFVRCLSVVVPPLLLLLAVSNNLTDQMGAVLYVTLVLSTPYLIALLVVDEIFKMKNF